MITTLTFDSILTGAIQGALDQVMAQAVAAGFRSRPCPERDQAEAALAEIFGPASRSLAEEHEAARQTYIAAYDAARQLGFPGADAEWSWQDRLELEARLDRTVTDGEVR